MNLEILRHKVDYVLQRKKEMSKQIIPLIMELGVLHITRILRLLFQLYWLYDFLLFNWLNQFFWCPVQFHFPQYSYHKTWGLIIVSLFGQFVNLARINDHSPLSAMYHHTRYETKLPGGLQYITHNK